MHVKASRRLLDKFRREAKRVFPREAYAVLIGRVAGNTVEVTQLFFPDDADVTSTSYRVTVPDKCLEEARKLARASGEIVVGDIHSHTMNCSRSHWREDGAPSSGDWAEATDYIHAICAIYKYKSGRLVARISFWPSYLGLKVTLTD